MHIYIGTRGILHETERFLRELSCQYLPFEKQDEIKNLDGTITYTPLKTYNLQVAVRPLMGGIYEICFPEKWSDLILNTLFGSPLQENSIKPRSITSIPQKTTIALLRKMLKSKPLPKTWKTDMTLACYTFNVEKIGIGMREDKWILNGKEVPKGTQGSWEAI